MNLLYTASATATGDGRNGHVRSSDGVLSLDLTTPKEMGGPGGALTNPEQLFAAGYAACFHSALKTVARKAKVALEDTAVTVDVGLGATPERTLQLSATLHIEIAGVDPAEAERLVAAAHERCP